MSNQLVKLAKTAKKLDVAGHKAELTTLKKEERDRLPFESPTHMDALHAKIKMANQGIDHVSKHAEQQGWRELDPGFLLQRKRTIAAFFWPELRFTIHGDGGPPQLNRKGYLEDPTHTLSFCLGGDSGWSYSTPVGCDNMVRYHGIVDAARNRREILGYVGVILGVLVFLATLPIVSLDNGFISLVLPCSLGIGVVLAVIYAVLRKAYGFGRPAVRWSPMDGAALPKDAASNYAEIRGMPGYRPLVIREATNWQMVRGLRIPKPVPPDPFLCAVHEESGRLFLVRHFDLTPFEKRTMVGAVK